VEEKNERTKSSVLAVPTKERGEESATGVGGRVEGER
jgi:hypothetical protein